MHLSGEILVISNYDENKQINKANNKQMKQNKSQFHITRIYWQRFEYQHYSLLFSAKSDFFFFNSDAIKRSL